MRPCTRRPVCQLKGTWQRVQYIWSQPEILKMGAAHEGQLRVSRLMSSAERRASGSHSCGASRRAPRTQRQSLQVQCSQTGHFHEGFRKPLQPSRGQAWRKARRSRAPALRGSSPRATRTARA